MTAHRLVVLEAMAWAQQQVQSPEQRWHKLLRREKGRLLTGGRCALPLLTHQDKRLDQAWLEIAQGLYLCREHKLHKGFRIDEWRLQQS